MHPTEISPAAAPPAATDTPRSPVLDALRGFAVLGILLANMQHFSGWFFLDEAGRSALPNAALSARVEFALAWLVDGKFYSLFSLLFGIGFAVMLGRAHAGGRDFDGFYRRRLKVLLGIGLVHGVLVWFGDILALYAVLGFALLAFNRKSDVAILQYAVIFFTLPVLQYFAVYAAFGSPPTGLAEEGQSEVVNAAVNALATGSWPEAVATNIGALLLGRYPDLLFTGRPFKVLATFLIGLWIGRRGIWSDPAAHRPLLRRVAAWGLLLGLPLNFALAMLMQTNAYYGIEPLGMVQSLVYAVGVPALALGYAAGFTLLWLRAPALPGIFAPVGRMALTSYLTHSVVGTAIFYGWGGGGFAATDLATATSIALAIFAAQLLLSPAWLAFFRYGPMEWAWRSITLRQAQPLLRSR
jgi:uncharacterized protein